MDVKTLFYLLFFVNLFLGVFTFVLKSSQPRFKYFNYWIIANISIAFGYLLYALRGVIFDWVSIFGANMLLAVGAVLRLLGLQKLFNLKITLFQLWLLNAALALFGLLLNLFYLVVDDILMRNVFIGIFHTCVGIYGGYLVISNAPAKNKGVYYLLGGVAFVFVAVLNFRIIGWVLIPRMRELFYTSLASDVQFVSSIVLDIAWTMLFLYIAIQESVQKQTESDDNFKHLADNATDGIIVFNEKRQIVYTSPSYLIQIGKVGAENYFMTDKEIYDNIHPADRKMVYDSFSDAIESRKTGVVYSYRVVHSSGNVFWREDKAQLNYDIAGKYTGAVVICRPYDKTLNHEEQIKKLSVAIEHSPTTILITDSHGRIEYVNPKFTELTGYTYNEVLGKNPKILKSGKTELSVIQQLWMTILSGNTWHGEFINKKKNGELFIERAHIAPVFDKNQRITNFIAIKEDITEKKKLEQELIASEIKYRLLAEKLTDVVWILNLDQMKFTYISSSVFHLRGYTAEEAMQQSLTESLTPESAAKVEKLTTERYKAFVNKEAVGVTYLDEVQQPCKNGSVIWVEVSTNFRYNDMREVEVVGVSRNIETRKKLELEILNQNLMLAELNATKDKFFGIIAHDLRSPFNTMLGFSEQLVKNHKNYDEQKRERLLQIVYQGARNTFSLLENLLTWSRSQTGRIKPEKKRIDLKISVAETVNLLNDNALNKQIAINNLITESLFVYADKNMLETVIRNLITNAVKYTPKQGKVEISATKHTDFYEIAIADNGIGMEKNTIDALFKIGNTKSVAGTEGEKGTGLGLLLCKEFVEKNGGKIWVESEPGKGSIFKFTLPAEE